MITLNTTSQRIDVYGPGHVTSPPEFYASYVDVTTTAYTPTINSGASSGIYTAVFAPSSSTQRQVKYLTIYNADTVSHALQIVFYNGTANRGLWKGTLLTGEAVVYTSESQWAVYSASGRVLSTAGDVVGPSSATDNAIAAFDGTTGKLIQNRDVTIDDSGNIALASGKTVDGVDVSALVVCPPDSQRIFMSPLHRGGAAKITTSGTAYWVYVGQVAQAITVKFVEFHVSTIGAGAQTAEVALASSPSAPNKANQTLTKIAATGTVDAVTATGVKRNTSTLNQAVAAGTHLWAGIRTAMATTQPTIEGLNFDMDQGQVLVTAGSGALTGAGPWTGSKLGTASLHGATSDVPDLRVTLD